MKKIIITGGSRGIGKGILHKLIKNKYYVINLSKNKKEFLKNKMLSNYKCDISNLKETTKVFNKIYVNHGDFYGLINNAGINPSRNNIVKTSFKDFDATLKTNVYGAFNCTKEFLKKKEIKKNSGVVINISSIVSVISHEKRASYSISKSAINGLTRSIVADYSNQKIRSFSICPGYVETDLTRNFLNNLDNFEKRNLIKKHKIGRLGNTKDIADLVSFLLDETKSSWMNGNIIPLDGGYVC